MAKYFLTRQEFAEELGIDPKTFRKILNEYKIVLPRGLITPIKAEEIRFKLGIFIRSEDPEYHHKKIG